MRTPLVAGNWKMNGSLASIHELIAELLSELNTQAEVVVFPPSVYIQTVRDLLQKSSIKVGMQNISDKNSGAFTGEISPLMAKDLGCEYVIIGHSERRELYKETDFDVAAKFSALIDLNLVPILCVGETLSDRKSGATMKVVGHQLKTVFDAMGPGRLGDFVIAYEPVWAIGSGLSATPEQIRTTHASIRGLLSEYDQPMSIRTRILYGGSVKADNAAELITQPDVDGFLVGGASLIAADFKVICHTVG